MIDKTEPPMPEPVFRLKLVYPDGTEILFDGGRTFERNLVQACRATIIKRGFVQLCKEAIVKRGVGFFRNETHVSKDIEDGISEVVVAGIEAGITEAILSLKLESLRVQ